MDAVVKKEKTRGGFLAFMVLESVTLNAFREKIFIPRGVVHDETRRSDLCLQDLHVRIMRMNGVNASTMVGGRQLVVQTACTAINKDALLENTNRPI